MYNIKRVKYVGSIFDTPSFTIGKIYDVLKELDIYFVVLDDNGDKMAVWKCCFCRGES